MSEPLEISGILFKTRLLSDGETKVIDYPLPSHTNKFSKCLIFEKVIKTAKEKGYKVIFKKD
jgi:hypothetical protein